MIKVSPGAQTSAGGHDADRDSTAMSCQIFNRRAAERSTASRLVAEAPDRPLTGR
jgi:hypothetical protein